MTPNTAPHANPATQTKLDAANHLAGLTAADHSMGPDDARITLLEYGDFECPACAATAPAVRQLVERLGPKIRFVFRHLPLLEVHPHAELAAEAAEAAAAQGKFWEMHDRLFATPNRLKLPDLIQHAQTMDLDMNRFHAELTDHIYTQRVQEHRRAAALSNVHTTPTFVLNGKRVDISGGFGALEAAVHAASR
ncbi:MAG: hypothetical protein RL039_261 [Pseudomonadota bacterium]|jgi:protein-disulfide isomerase